MNRYEKISWFTLAFFVLSVIVFAFFIPVIGISRASAILGLIGFAIIFSAFFFRSKDPFDERDRVIYTKARQSGRLVSWLFFVCSLIGIWGWYYIHRISDISIGTLPRVMFIGILIGIVVQSLTAVILYRRGVVHGES